MDRLIEEFIKLSKKEQKEYVDDFINLVDKVYSKYKEFLNRKDMFQAYVELQGVKVFVDALVEMMHIYMFVKEKEVD